MLGSQLPAGSGQFKEADVQESTQLASSKISRLGSSSIDCRDKSLKGETLLETSGSNSCSWPPDSHMHMHMHGDGLFTLPSADFVPWARGICISLFFYVISVYKLYLQTWHGEEAHAECICILLVAGEWL